MKINFIIESVLPLLFVLPLTILFIKDKSQINTIALFSVIFIVHEIILHLPKEFIELQLIKGKWNWTGKLAGIIFGIFTYIILRDKLKSFDFLQFRQNPKTFFKTLVVALIMVCTSFFSYFDSVKEFDWETLIFQLTMPGFDEEIIFRAILLGLLLTSLNDNIKIGRWTLGNPSILIVNLLFGLVHGIHFKNNFGFEPYPFFASSLYGYVWGWITIKSRSILLPVISHNLTNFLNKVLIMI